MGLTQHAHGVDTIRALLNVALARGLVGRPHRGLMPIRGHSGVQGGAEVGCTPAVDGATRDRWSALWGLRGAEASRASPPTRCSRPRRAAGSTRSGWSAATSSRPWPTRARTRRALHRPRLRVHHDIVLSSSMLVDPSDTVLVLPATTRYEAPGGGTETSTERRIIFSPEIAGRRIGSARAEWWVLGEVMARVRPAAADQLRYRGRSGHPRRDRACGAALRRHRDAAGGRRPGAVGRTTALRRRAVRHGGRTRAVQRRAAARTSAGARDVLASPPAAASSSTRWCSDRSIR